MFHCPGMSDKTRWTKEDRVVELNVKAIPTAPGQHVPVNTKIIVFITSV